MKKAKTEKSAIPPKIQIEKPDLKISTKQELSSPTGKMGDSIPRNVNSFLHLIGEHSAVNGDGINWVLTLRTPKSLQESLSKIPDAPFSFYGKSIICQKDLSKPPRDFIVSGTDNLHTCSNLYWHRQYPTIGCGQVDYFNFSDNQKASFETGLRNYSMRNKDLRQKELKFRPHAFNDNKYEPYFLAPVKKTQKGFPVEKIKAWEGRVPYPKYDTKFANVNHNEVKHLYKPQVEMGQINWALQLRGYKNHELRKDLTRGDFPFRRVGELGPKHQIQT